MEGVVNRDFWNGKRVFLTGHTGFKGSWLSLWLTQMGAKVTGFALEPATRPSLYSAANIAAKIDSHIGDINDYKKLNAVLEDSKPEIVIHMAAQALVRYSYENPIETFQTNVIGAANLLQACRFQNQIKAVINVTSDKCYENKERLEGYREDEPMGGYDPYSSSKGCAELVTSAFRRSFYQSGVVGIASARAGNVIGGGDWALDRLIPDIMRSVSAGKSVSIRNPNAIRPWQHVMEPLSGYLVLAQKIYSEPKKYSEGYNFGPAEEDAKPVEYIVKKITEKWGDGASYKIEPNPNAPHEAHYLKLDITKAQEQLGWRPVWSIDQTIEKTVEWFKAFAQYPAQAFEITKTQIAAYEKSMSLK
jgi:CDP-glucose 4,6-dehydratase